MGADWRQLWAKSGEGRRDGGSHALWKHLLDASAVALALPNPLSDFGWSEVQAALLVGLHDVGKADAAFQRQAPDLFREVQQAGFPDTADPRCRHERLSTEFTRKMLRKAGMSERDADTIGRAVVAHHGNWVETPREVPSPYKEAQEELFRLLKDVIGVAQLPGGVPHNHSAFGMRLAGYIVLCDWIASNEEFFTDDRLKGITDPADYFMKVGGVAREWVGKLGLERSSASGRATSVVEVPRPIQQALLSNDISPGLVIIEAPMGEGKTEAAWILAEKWRDKGYRGMYMALPTMATSDSLYGRYRDQYLGKLGRGEHVRLVHGMAWLRDEREPEKEPQAGELGDDGGFAAAWFRPTRRAILAAHGVGTVDQAMLAGMNVKFGFLRLFGLADKVLVIDELHAYDAYMSGIIGRLLQWCACLRIPVILLSATLSAKQRAAMCEAYGATGPDLGPEAPYPLITMVEPREGGGLVATFRSEKGEQEKLTTFTTRTLRIETYPGLLRDAKKTALKAAELVKNGGCCCVILNTVKQAQAVYRELRMPEGRRLLFHARFTAADRERITHEVLARFGKNSTCRPSKFVLVATQVVEQSLDVDFDHMVSEIAPIDLLLQRSGRLHRHIKREPGPTLHVLLPDKTHPDLGGTAYVYAEKPILRTLALLGCTSTIRLPSDLRMLIERCYGRDEWEQSEVDWKVVRNADQAWDKETQFLHSRSRGFTLCEPSGRVFRPVNNDPTGDDSDDGNGWRARTRLGSNDLTAVLVDENQLTSLESGEVSIEEARALYRRSIKLPAYLPIHVPEEGYLGAMEAKGRLRGLTLFPITRDGRWRGIDEKGNRYEVAYDKDLGLVTGRIR